MSSENIIAVENLSKRYIIGHQVAKGDGVRHAIENAVRAPVTWLRNRRRASGRTREEVWGPARRE
jgi:hypothetical protein